MALTVAFDRPRRERISRSLSIITGTIDFDASYPTGGEVLTDITAKFKTLYRITFDQKGGYMFEFDKTNSKVKVYNSSVEITPAGTNAAATISVGATHAGGAIELSSNANGAALGDAGGAGYTGITGVQAAAFTGTKVDATKATEVASTANLSTLTGVSFIAVGL